MVKEPLNEKCQLNRGRIRLSEAIPKANDMMEGKIRGRVIVDVNS